MRFQEEMASPSGLQLPDSTQSAITLDTHFHSEMVIRSFYVDTSQRFCLIWAARGCGCIQQTGDSQMNGFENKLSAAACMEEPAGESNILQGKVLECSTERCPHSDGSPDPAVTYKHKHRVKYFNIPVIFGKGPWAQVLRTSHVQHLPLFFRYANTTFSCQERWEMCYYAAFYCTNEKQNHSYVAVLASCRQDQTPTLIITSKTQGYQSHAVLVKTWWNEVCSSLNFWHRWQCSHFTEFHFLVPDHLLLWALLVRVHLYS